MAAPPAGGKPATGTHRCPRHGPRDRLDWVSVAALCVPVTRPFGVRTRQMRFLVVFTVVFCLLALGVEVWDPRTGAPAQVGVGALTDDEISRFKQVAWAAAHAPAVWERFH